MTATTIEPSEATEPLAYALEQQERMLAPQTMERLIAATHISGIGLAGAGAVGLSGSYPPATPTLPTAAQGADWEAVRRLAALALQPLGATTAPAFLASTASLLELAQLARQAVHGTEETRAYRAFAQLASWLGRTQAETAQLLGVGRTTALAWRRGHEPRPARARRLYQTHALVKTIVRRAGVDEARRWLERGAPSPLDLIGRGDVTAADDRAEALIFGSPTVTPRLDAWQDEPASMATPQAESRSSPPRRVSRGSPRRRVR